MIVDQSLLSNLATGVNQKNIVGVRGYFSRSVSLVYHYQENFFPFLFHMNFIRKFKSLFPAPFVGFQMLLTKYLLVPMDIEALFEFGHSFSDMTRYPD